MIESATNLANGTRLKTGICIIGAGPAGIALALRLVGKGADIIMIEAGGERETKANARLFVGEVVDPATHSPTDQYRHRVLGGATATWGGRCIPLDPIDFEVRDWIPESGWPITYRDVAAYYPEAVRLAEAGDCIFSAAQAVESGMKEIVKGFEPQHFDTDSIERFSCPTNFGQRYRSALAEASDLRLILEANCTEIVTAEDGASVEKIVLETLSGKRFELEAKKFVMAAGGLEVPRLLLASRRHHSSGIGNDRDLVGRYYMCHIAGVSGEVRFSVDPANVFHGYENTWDGVYCRRRFQLHTDVQREQRIGNIALRLHHSQLADPSHGRGILSAIYLAKPFISYEYSKRLHGTKKLTPIMLFRHILNILREPFETMRFLLSWLRKRTFALRKFPSLIVCPRNNIYSLEVHSEQVPNRESRVYLSEKSDRFGRPQIKIDWRHLPIDIETVQKAMTALRSDLRASGKGDLIFSPPEIKVDMLRDGAFGGHHIGTTRMAADPEHGVVDRDCRVFGINNLFIASSSVFPTAGQANPTLTIIALALQLADHLSRRLK